MISKASIVCMWTFTIMAAMMTGVFVIEAIDDDVDRYEGMAYALVPCAGVSGMAFIAWLETRTVH